ncbi:MAG: nucleotidyltransferase domain-containing protein [Nitrospira sp. LK70]|nr:nucleotidyltransferase domain-containing protein [Nitrospira sp. LK70]
MLKEAFAELADRTVSAVRAFYGDRLVSVVLYGSVARGTMRHDSDMDLLIVADPLPNGRLNRVREFEAVEEALEEGFSRAASRGVHTVLSPVFKTAHEVQAGSPLFLDLVEDARVLYDRNEFFSQELARLRKKLSRLGAKRIWRGNAWYWDLKPDYRPGEVFEL